MVGSKSGFGGMSITMIGSHVILEKVPVAASARLDRRFVDGDTKNWLRQIKGKVRLAIIWRIPVGFEDETGFHLGVQQARKDKGMDWERASLFADDKHF